MSGYYWNKMMSTNYKREYDRDYAVVKKIQKGRITIEICYNSDIQTFDVVVGKNLTANEATNLLNTYK